MVTTLATKQPRFRPGEALLEAGGIPTPPGTYLRNYLQHMDASFDEAAQRLDMSPTGLRGLLENRVKIGKDLADRLSQYTGLTAGFWLNLQASADLAEERQPRPRLR